METKEQVIRLFLAFLSRYVPLGQAQLATLGGRGIEAEIWSALGIPSEHGWLIERSRKSGGALIRDHHYQVHNQLGTFDRILAGYGPERACIDGFHLDLCGTFCNAAIANFAPVIPLVLAGAGRCLAVTVADARRNLVLEQWPKFQKRAEKLFGKKKADGFYDRILAYQRRVPIKKDPRAFIKPFDPVKAARREFGLLVELTELLRKQKLPWVPVAVERYIYVSHYLERPFRMRTYFFRFGKRTTHSPELAFARAWITSTLSFANGDGFHEVVIPPNGTVVPPVTQEGGSTAMAANTEVLYLTGYVALAQAEYEALLADRQQLLAIRVAYESVNGISHPTPTSALALPAPQSVPLENGELIKVQLELLRSKAEDDLHEGYERAFRALAITGRKYSKNRRRIVGALVARTQGRFRANFLARVIAVRGENALLELAELYSKIGKQPITVDFLRKEAAAAK